MMLAIVTKFAMAIFLLNAKCSVYLTFTVNNNSKPFNFKYKKNCNLM